MTTVDSYSQDLISRVRQAEKYRGDFGTMVFSQILVDLIQHQEHMNKLILYNLRHVADMLQAQEVQS